LKKPISDRGTRWGIGLVVIILVYLAFIGGKNGYLARREKACLIDKLTLEIQRLNEGNKQLRQEIQSLQGDLNYLEKIAREKLGFVKKGEIIYKFVP